MNVKEFIEKLSTYKQYAYIYGAKGEKVTQALIDRLAQENPKMYTSTYKAKAKRLIGRKAVDCSGLICCALGISQVGSSYMKDHWLNGSKSLLTEGLVLWRQGHVAVYIGNNTIIESKGIDYGVKFSTYNADSWTCTLVPPTVEFEYDYQNLGWNQDSTGWWYCTGHWKGDYYKNCIAVIAGEEFMFDSKGYMVKDLGFITTDSRGVITKYQSVNDLVGTPVVADATKMLKTLFPNS